MSAATVLCADRCSNLRVSSANQRSTRFNQLLLVGFYLVNGGWVARSLKTNQPPLDASQVIENVATSYGTVLLILGVMHFGNLYVLNRMRRRAITDRSAAPVAPEQYFQPARVGA